MARRGVAALADEFEAVDLTGTDPVTADYNVAPTKPVPIIVCRRRSGDTEGPVFRQLRVARWGLVPSWAARPGGGSVRGGRLLINARAESVARTPAFRAAVVRRRCLVPADGWYEWVRAESGPGRQPFYLTHTDGELLAFAGLYELWGDARLMTTAIVTTAATGELARIHDRMPLLLPRRAWAGWLDPARPDPSDLLVPDPAPLDRIELRPVGSAVGNVANNGPGLIAAVPPPAAEPVPAPVPEPMPAPQTLF